MPYTIRKKPGKNCYMVIKRKTKRSGRRITAKCSSRKNAESQLRLLRAIQYNKRFVPRGSRKKRG